MARRGRDDKTGWPTSDLPLDSSGEVDWNALGSLLTAHLLSETSAVSALDHKHGLSSRHDLLNPSDTSSGWQYTYEKYGVVVFRKRLRNSPLTCFLGRGLIDMPLDEVAMFVKKVENNLSWDKFLVEARYIKTLSESERHTDYIGYQFFELNGCVITAHRDMLYYVRCLFTDDGKYVQAAHSVDDTDYLPVRGVPRVELHKGTGFVLEPYLGDPSKTLVNYLAHVNLRGLPAILHNQVLKRHPLAISYIRQQLTGPVRWNPVASVSVTHSAPASFPTHTGGSSPYEEPVPVGLFLGNGRRQLADIREGDREATHVASGGDTKDDHQVREKLDS